MIREIETSVLSLESLMNDYSLLHNTLEAYTSTDIDDKVADSIANIAFESLTNYLVPVDSHIEGEFKQVKEKKSIVKKIIDALLYMWKVIVKTFEKIMELFNKYIKQPLKEKINRIDNVAAIIAQPPEEITDNSKLHLAFRKELQSADFVEYAEKQVRFFKKIESNQGKVFEKNSKELSKVIDEIDKVVNTLISNKGSLGDDEGYIYLATELDKYIDSNNKSYKYKVDDVENDYFQDKDEIHEVINTRVTLGGFISRYYIPKVNGEERPVVFEEAQASDNISKVWSITTSGIYPEPDFFYIVMNDLEESRALTSVLMKKMAEVTSVSTKTVTGSVGPIMQKVKKLSNKELTKDTLDDIKKLTKISEVMGKASISYATVNAKTMISMRRSNDSIREYMNANITIVNRLLPEKDKFSYVK